MANGNGDVLKRYLEQVRLIRGSQLATNERSYYPALDTLFNAVGETLNPPVLAIHDVADAGAGHPDFTLQVKGSDDLRAVVEAKGSDANVDAIAQSEQVMRYLKQYGLCLVTNLHDFKLVRLNRANQPEEVMRQCIGLTEAHFWREPVETLVRDCGEEMSDFLTSVLLWEAPVTRPKDLADALARYARAARREMERRPDAGLQPLRKALAEALGLHFTDDQGEHFFRSSLVQTLFYGLFSAWVAWNRDHPNAPAEDFRWREAGDYLHLPVLRELFEHIAIGSQLESLHIRKPLEWAEATLRRTVYGNFAAVFADGSAVNYFYEPFLEAYDPDLREQLGVWYTPREIIQYQVARVDRLLRDELRIADGLADDRVIVLDPATGTGGYLLEVLRVIDRTLRDNGDDATRGMRLRRAATSRVFGFEILPAPFVVAHLQIATLLAHLGGTLAANERSGVYLTNSLTGWKVDGGPKQLSFPEYPELLHEAEAAAQVKHDARILVVLGNPPYRAQAGVAEDEEYDLIAPYYTGLSERFGLDPRGLNDLYVRFFRLAERQIAERTGQGIVSFISNSSWLDGLSHPVMRERMVSAFDHIWIDNLNGGGRFKGSRGPDGLPDRSVFEYVGSQGSTGIMVPTAIATLVKTGQPPHDATILYRDLWGQGHEKRALLARDAELTPSELSYAFETLAPSAAARFLLLPGGSEGSYHSWFALPSIFPIYYPGVTTARDEYLVAYDRETITANMNQYFDGTLTDAQVAERMPRLMEGSAYYDPSLTRTQLLQIGFQPENVRRYYYRPLDLRWVYWEGTTKLLDRARPDFAHQIFTGNLFLEARQRQPKPEFDRTTVTPFLADNTGNGRSSFFPIFVKDRIAGVDQVTPNINPELASALSWQWAIQDKRTITETLFYHVVAIMQSPQYRTENSTYLYRDWPRIPLPATCDLLQASAALGKQVGDLLRPDVSFTLSQEQRRLAVPRRIDGGQLSDDDLRVTVRYNGIGRYEPGVTDGSPPRPSRLWWNDVACWENVPPEVWAFTIGGYPVVKKWLDYRHIEKLKRPLRLDEVTYVSEMVRRIAALLALGPTLDASYQAVKANTLALAPSAVPAPAGPFQTTSDDEE